MFRRLVSGIMLTLLLTSMLTLAFNIQPCKAEGAIYIRADGSIDPPTAPISSTDNATYTFTDNINDEIVVERDNIILDGAGYTVQGTGSGTGISLSGRNNIIIKNIEIKSFNVGIDLGASAHANNIFANKITASNWYGIGLNIFSSNNNMTENKITSNNIGISLYQDSTDNIISWNSITANNESGIILTTYSFYNSIFSNNIAANQHGIWVDRSGGTIYHNNFLNNVNQTITFASSSIWDNGYPSGGNYWSNYIGEDSHNGPYQNHTGSDGIGDLPYVIDGNNQDNYPLMKPYPWSSHDVGVTSVISSKTIVPQGFNVSIKTMLFNYGNYTENINMTIYANTTIIGEINNIGILSRNFTIVTFIWNTSGFALGNYTVKAVADQVSGEIDMSDNTFINGEVIICKLGDLNLDNTVNYEDASLFRQAYIEEYNPLADFNQDNTINYKDASLFRRYYIAG